MQNVHDLRRALFSQDSKTRFDSRHRLLGKLARRWLGAYSLPNPYVVWPEEAAQLNQLWRQESQADRDLKDRSYILYSLTQALAHLPGDSAECGVFQGAGSFVICLGLTRGGKTGFRHHAFDSFQGLSQPTIADQPSDARAQRWQTSDLSVGVDAVRHNLRRFDFVDYHPGWIPERFSDVMDRQFAFVHIDVDLHAPTLDSLAFFYPRMVTGGVLLCDDYGSIHCPGAHKAFDDFMQDKPEKIIHLTTGQGLIVKQPVMSPQ